MTIQKLPPSGTTIPTVQLTILTTGHQTAYTKPPHSLDGETASGIVEWSLQYTETERYSL